MAIDTVIPTIIITSNADINSAGEMHQEPSCRPTKNIFTCTLARQPTVSPASLKCKQTAAAAAQHEQWLAEQREQVKEYRMAQHEVFMQHHQGQARMSEAQCRIAIKVLCAEAARYHRAIASTSSEQQAEFVTFAEGLTAVQHERNWWPQFSAQVHEFLHQDVPTTSTTTDATSPPSPSVSQRAMENISSLGMWFVGDGMSLSTRRYTMLAFSHNVVVTTTTNAVAESDEDGVTTVTTTTPVYTPVVIVGLSQFAYSNFVHDVRNRSQSELLVSLCQKGTS